MTNSRFLTLLLMLLPWLGGSLAAEDFDPSNPPEPNEIYKSNVYTYASPADKGYASGAGRYLEGTKVTISASASEANWVFKHWLIDGEIDAAHTSRSFTYTVGG